MIRLAASSMARAFACPPSVMADTIRVSVTNDAGNTGSAAHEAMEAVVAAGYPDLDQIADRWGVDRDELGRLTWYGMQTWRELEPSFKNPRTEVSHQLQTEHFLLRCRIDLETPPARVVHGLDWKFGRVDGDYYHQLAANAACIILAPESIVEEAVMTIVWAREQQAETYTFTRESCRAWIADVESRVIGREGYRVGPQCTYCPRSHACEAMIAMAKRDVGIFSNVELRDKITNGLVDMTAADIVSMVRRGKIVVGAFEAFLDAVRRLVETQGPLDSGDGHLLKLVEENGRREIDTTKAWPILTQEFTPAELRTILIPSATKMDKLAAEKAGRGNGAAAKRALHDNLVAADALTQGTIQKLKEVRKLKEIK